MQKLEELIAALKVATGPDHELDADILEATGGCAHRETEYYCIEDGNDVDSGFTCKRCGKDTYGLRVLAYTTYLDAAVALAKRVLPGWRIRTEHGENYSITEFIRGWGGRTEVLGIATSERPDDHIALCICTAALRSKLSQEKNNADK
ncbi:hypothetical protein G6L15_08315 [Agrobacterium rhizogenes]|uniref:hypothetical protein n=1 Tax=Rhizobium rhizogenes TaxID=359 RepID=UPI001573B149|nr:hypothetical protein [Rhizobium rhizogenes]NTG86148.1 hypothetical protein [Rhizobium rhizogenes]